MDKFIIKRVYPEYVQYRRIAIRSDTSEMLDIIHEKTGAKYADILDACISFCLKRLVVVEPEEDE